MRCLRPNLRSETDIYLSSSQTCHFLPLEVVLTCLANSMTISFIKAMETYPQYKVFPKSGRGRKSLVEQVVRTRSQKLAVAYLVTDLLGNT